MPKIWRDRLLESHSLAVLSAVGVALVVFPGADLARFAQPFFTRAVAAEPQPVVAPVAPKGPEARLTGASAPSSTEDTAGTAAREPAPESKSAPPRTERAPPTNRAFDGCLETHPESACRRAFDAAVERQARTKPSSGDAVISQASLAPLAFDDDPQWVQRLEALAQDGIAFKRMRTGGGNEWVFGITREGVLGFSFEERRGD